jgi:F-type H+-transporting ATPase subunit gamma
MAGLKEIKRRLRSVKNTQKITYAMKLVSAAKLRKAQEAVTSSRAYTNELNGLLSQLSRELSAGDSVEGSGASHALLMSRSEVKNVGLLVVGGQRGLCGGYNTNISKKCESFLKLHQEKGTATTAILLGRKPAEYFRRRGYSYDRAFEDLPESAALWPIDDIAQLVSSNFRSANVDEVWIIFTRFRSAISQQVILEKLLPLDTSIEGATQVSSEKSLSAAVSGLTLFEPSAKDVFSALLPRILSAKIRQACLDAKASETAARMTAMDSATKNAKQLSRKLELQHNKIRQARITSELLDIIGGAEAVQ